MNYFTDYRASKDKFKEALNIRSDRFDYINIDINLTSYNLSRRVNVSDAGGSRNVNKRTYCPSSPLRGDREISSNELYRCIY